MFKFKRHNNKLYNTLLILSRNIFFYTNIGLKDSFETRIYLMFIHFSILMIIFKNRNEKFNQSEYDNLFHNIEYNLRELGFGDVTVNKKMKDLNKLLYDILLKIEENANKNSFNINKSLIIKYFKMLDSTKSDYYRYFSSYFTKFFNFCFELPLENMIRDCINFRY